jgi:hypothetical protein
LIRVLLRKKGLIRKVKSFSKWSRFSQGKIKVLLKGKKLTRKRLRLCKEVKV